MNQLDEQKALRMMELNADATKDDISKRYGILTRKFRTMKKDENGYTLEEITDAYNLLMGITFTDKNEEERQKTLRDHPPLLARILKKDPVKLENFFHYYKIHILIGFGVILLAFFTVRSCVNQVRPDFNMILYGRVYMEDKNVLETDIREKVPELTAPQVQIMGSDGSDPQYEYAVQMKLMAMLAAKEIDIIVMDGTTFGSLASQGMLLPLGDQMNMLGFPAESYVQAAEIIEQPIEGEPVMGPPKIYGVDITGSNYVKDKNILGEKIIAAVVVNSPRIDKALAYLQTMK